MKSNPPIGGLVSNWRHRNDEVIGKIIMLVLQRLINEEVIITCPDGTRITVAVIDILEHTVRLGFKAPLNYLIDRKEITDLKDKAQKL